MKASINTGKMRLLFKVFSPFLLLATFLVIRWAYIIIITAHQNAAQTWKIILIPFIIANIVYADIGLWNYLKEKNYLYIWCIESLITVLIIQWIV